MHQDFRRWYDKDPILKEALELLKLQADERKSEAADFINQLQQQVAQDVIESVYEMVTRYAGKGNRWYDNDPVMFKAVELLRLAPPATQKNAALKLLTALDSNSLDNIDFNDDSSEK